MSRHHSLSLIGVATDLAGNIPGTSLAPSVIKESLTAQDGYRWLDLLELNPDLTKQSTLQQLADLLGRLSDCTYQQVRDGRPFVTVGGDHSVAVGSWSGVSKALQLTGDTFGLIWMDAHLDAHTQSTSHTQNVHGMPAAALLGQDKALLDALGLSQTTLKPGNLFYIGVRSFEPEEWDLVQSLGCHVYDMQAIHEKGMEHIIAEIHHTLQSNKVDKIGFSIDIDVLDPAVASAVTVPEEGGMTVKQISDAIEGLGDLYFVLGAEIVEYCPDRDRNEQSLTCIHHLLDALRRCLMGDSVASV